MTSKRIDLTVDAIASFTSVAEPTIASSVAGIPDIDANAQDLLEDSTEESDYTGIEWSRLPQYHKPHHGFKGTPSWVWKYGYRLQKGKKIYWQCRYCHQHKRPHISVTKMYPSEATSGPKRHL
ncbi:hypothetical protein BJ546DRAFT_846415, partial [Cryomyces antarcticus]